MTDARNSAGPAINGCSLSMPCHLDEVRPKAAEAKAFLLAQQVSEAEADSCELALVEALNNAVLYALPEKRHLPIDISIFCQRDHLELHITDHTGGFDWPRELNLPSPTEEHGRGLFIIHSVIDEISYLRGAEENRLILRKSHGGAESEKQKHANEGLSQNSERERLSCDELTNRILLSEQATATMAKELCFRSEALHAIFRCSSEIAKGASVEDFADRLLDDLLPIAEADWFVLRLASADQAELLVKSISHKNVSLTPIPLPHEPASGETIWAEQQAALTRHEFAFGTQGDQALQPDDPITGLQANSQGFVRPILHGETLLGTLALGRDRSVPPFLAEQVEVIRTFSEFLAIQIVNADLQRREVDLQVTAHELEIARNIQESLLPKYFPSIPGFGLAGFCLSARHVGGDFYDAFEVARGRVLLVVADVMGKGIPAALFAATLHTLVRTMAEWTHEPAELLARMNRQMFEELSAVDMFITAQLILVDSEKQCLTVASAGHCPLLISTKNGAVNALAPDGLPLGILPRAIFREQTIPLDQCSAVLLYTDGLTEARNLHGDFFGQLRLEQWLRESTAQAGTAYELSWKFMAEFKSFQTQVQLADDQTFLIMSEEAGNLMDRETGTLDILYQNAPTVPLSSVSRIAG